jgi:hypothetical protein
MVSVVDSSTSAIYDSTSSKTPLSRIPPADALASESLTPAAALAFHHHALPLRLNPINTPLPQHAPSRTHDPLSTLNPAPCPIEGRRRGKHR